MPRLCTICARGGSKGLPGKNIRPLLGLPLIVHSIRQARASGLFDVVAVSSDGADILAVAAEAGADEVIRRPDDLAGDSAPKPPAIRHAVLETEARRNQRYDTLVDLCPTAPLRLAVDIVGAVRLLEESGAASVITGSEARRNPYFNLVEQRPDGTVAVSKAHEPPFNRRQDAPPCFDMNASIYVWRRDDFVRDPKVFHPSTRLYEMPPERSVDIDSALDFEIVAFLMERAGRAAGRDADSAEG